MATDSIKLNTGDTIPNIGFGTWQLAEGNEATNAVLEALKSGYRLIDTARIYGNETSVGRAINESGLARKDVFVTTKLWNSDQGYESGFNAFEQSLNRLGMDYIDLYLIHWPASEKRGEAWRALEEIYKSGRAKNVGVSNYFVGHLEELLESSQLVPSVNQIEFHPFIYKQQLETVKYCRKHGIVIEAYSPLARGHMNNPLLKEIAGRHGKSVAQVMIRWCLQHDTVPIPKSANAERIRENYNVFDFELTGSEMEHINGLGQVR